MNETTNANPLDMPVEGLALSVRSRNCLKAAKIRLVGELVQLTAEKLLGLPNFGRTSLEDVMAALAEWGLALRQEAPCGFPSPVPAPFGTRNLPELSDLQKGLVTLPVSVLAAGVRLSQGLVASGCQTLGDVLELYPQDLLKLDNFGRASVAELRARLGEFGLAIGMLRGINFATHKDEWSRQFGAMARAHLSEKRERDLLVLTEGSTDIGARLRGLAMQFVDRSGPNFERNTRILTRLYGWDGGAPSTLEATAQEVDLTRERVRQLSEKFKRRLLALTDTPQWLANAADAIQAIAPCRVEDAPDLLSECEIDLGYCDIRGVLVAASLYGSSTDVCVPRDGDMQAILCTSRQRTLGTRAASRARSLTRRFGCFSRETLLARLDSEGHDATDILRLLPLILTSIGIVWLDPGKEWGFVPNVSRSRLFSILRKALSIGNALSLEELRGAVRRNLHMEGFAPPLHVLRAILENVPWAAREDGLFRGVDLDQNAEVIGNDRLLLNVLEDAGGVIDRYSLVDRCTKNGMNSASCQLLITHSPVVTPHSTHVFSIPGFKIPPGTLERLTPPATRKRVVREYGRTADGRIWVVVRSSPSVVANGLVNIPGAFAGDLQGRFEIVSAGDDDLEEADAPRPVPSGGADTQAVTEPRLHATVSSLMLTGLRPLLIERAAEVGDSILLIFAPASRTLEVRVGDQGMGAEFPSE